MELTFKRKDTTSDTPWLTLCLSLAATLAVPAATLVGQWEFGDPDNLGKATVGPDLEILGTTPLYRDVLVDENWVAAEGVVLTQPGEVGETNFNNGFRVPNPVGANGGGTEFTNEYALVYDILAPESTSGKWRSLLQTDLGNQNDGDYFLSDSGELGVRALGYSEPIREKVWIRLVLNFKIGSGVEAYINGEHFFTHPRTSADPEDPDEIMLPEDDNRFALGEWFYLFADDCRTEVENHSVYVSEVRYYDGNLTPEEIAALGAAGTRLIPPPANVISFTGFEMAEYPVSWPKAGGNELPIPAPDPFPASLLYAEDGQKSLPFRPSNRHGTVQVREQGNPFGTGQYLYIDGYEGNPTPATPGYGKYNGDFGIVHWFPRVLPKHSTIQLDFCEPSSTDPNLKGPMTFGVGKSGDVGKGGAYVSWQIREGKILQGYNVIQSGGPDISAMAALSLDHPYRMHIKLNTGALPWKIAVPGETGEVDVPGHGAALYIEDLNNGGIHYYGVWETTNPEVSVNSFGAKSFNKGAAGNALILDNFLALDESVAEAGEWTGASDNLWSNPDNWAGETVPAEGNALHFPVDDNASFMENDLLPGALYDSLEFTLAGGMYDLIGNELALTGQILLSDNVLATIGNDVELADTVHVSIGANAILELYGTLSGIGDLVVEGDAMGELDIVESSEFDGAIVVNQGMVVVEGDQTASTGGWIIGSRAGLDEERCDVTFGQFASPAQIEIAAGKTFQLGNPGGGGVGRSVNVSDESEVVNHGSLILGHHARFTLWDDSTWRQEGRLEVHGIWGYGAELAIRDEAVFTYSGSEPIRVFSGTNESGRGRIILSDGGTLVTNQPILYKTDWNGERLKAKLAFLDANLKITDDIPELNPIGDEGSRVHVVLEGDATIDTGAYHTAVVLSEMLQSPQQEVETFQGPGAGSLVKTGSGTLTIDSAPLYLGDTVVEEGTLVLNEIGLDDESEVILEAGAILNLNFAGVDTVGGLVIDGVEYGPGTYGADDPSGALQGAGQLRIVSNSGFTGWAAAWGLSGEPEADSDGDGLSDVLEYALGLNPTEPNGSAGEIEGPTIRFAKNPLAVASGDVEYLIEVSGDLVGWDSAVSQGIPVSEDGSQISITIPEGLGLGFARLRVKLAP